MNKALLTELKQKKEAHKKWKQSQVTWKGYGDIVQLYRDGVRKGHLGDLDRLEKWADGDLGQGNPTYGYRLHDE